MARWPLRETLIDAGARFAPAGGVEVVDRFSELGLEHKAAREAVVLYPAHERGLLEVGGRDRVDWLHNLLTNDVKVLSPGRGCYSFVLDSRGRILMDLNVLAGQEAIWLDIDRSLVPKALAHFDRYTFSEDVTIYDASDQTDRLVLLGGGLEQLAETIGGHDALGREPMGVTALTLNGLPVRAVRHDTFGLPALELHVPAEWAADGWVFLRKAGESVGLRPIGWRTVRTLQIEAGVPVYGRDIDESVLPAETNQLERAVSFTKGCYIGQEIVARMKTHGSVARRMVGLRLMETPLEMPHDRLLLAEGKAVGRLTSACESPAVGGPIALAYLSTKWATPGRRVQVASDPPVEAEIVVLPFHASAEK